MMGIIRTVNFPRSEELSETRIQPEPENVVGKNIDYTHQAVAINLLLLWQASCGEGKWGGDYGLGREDRTC